MKKNIIENLKRCYCPNEYNIDVKCKGTCSIEQMSKCWDKVFEKYSLEVSDEPMLYKFTFRNCSYGFRKKCMSEKIEY